jgi:hypothetical protein
MICEEFSFTTGGDVGEGVLRHALVNNLERKGRIHVLDGGAHLTIWRAVALGGGPAFTLIRNPFSVYISCWIHRLRNRRFFGGFSEWFYDEGFVFSDYWVRFNSVDFPISNIIRFEHLEDDFARILPSLWSGVTSKEVHSWFPDAYRQWSNRNWSESIEQWMRPELYTEDMINIVYEQDRWIFDDWGYKFGDRVIPKEPAN